MAAPAKTAELPADALRALRAVFGAWRPADVMRVLHHFPGYATLQMDAEWPAFYAALDEADYERQVASIALERSRWHPATCGYAMAAPEGGAAAGAGRAVGPRAIVPASVAEALRLEPFEAPELPSGGGTLKEGAPGAAPASRSRRRSLLHGMGSGAAASSRLRSRLLPRTSISQPADASTVAPPAAPGANLLGAFDALADMDEEELLLAEEAARKSGAMGGAGPGAAAGAPRGTSRGGGGDGGGGGGSARRPTSGRDEATTLTARLAQATGTVRLDALRAVAEANAWDAHACSPVFWGYTASPTAAQADEARERERESARSLVAQLRRGRGELQQGTFEEQMRRLKETEAELQRQRDARCVRMRAHRCAGAARTRPPPHPTAPDASSTRSRRRSGRRSARPLRLRCRRGSTGSTCSGGASRRRVRRRRRPRTTRACPRRRALGDGGRAGDVVRFDCATQR